MFEVNGIVSFDKIIKNKQLKLGLLSNGQFGKNIDTFTEHHKNQANIFYRNNSTNQLNHYKMILKGRLDYIVDWSFLFHENISKLSKNKQDQLVFLLVSEQTEPNNGHAICNSISDSQQVIKKINHTLLSQSYKTQQINILNRHLPKNLHDMYQVLNQQNIGL